MHTTAPTPARLRMLIEGIDCPPTVTPALAALTAEMSDIGLTPDQLHPVIALLLRQATLRAAPSYGWTRQFAIELAVEQAEEFRRHGLVSQLYFLCGALDCDPVAMALCLYGVHRGETEAVLQRLAVPELADLVTGGMPMPWRRVRRRPVS
jgi:hypothetical protein